MTVNLSSAERDLIAPGEQIFKLYFLSSGVGFLLLALPNIERTSNKKQRSKV